MKGKFWRKALAAALALLIVSGSTPIKPVSDLFGGMAITASALESETSGQCGDNATWSLDDAGKLTISGTGAMYEFNAQPWYNYKNNITSVEIKNGITSIGNCAFLDCTGLTSITIPDSVTSIGDFAFSNCTSLTSITISDSVESIGADAFRNCTGITDVYCYADPSKLTWNEDCCDDFKEDGTTVCHVPRAYYLEYVKKFSGSVNVTFDTDTPHGQCGENAYFSFDTGTGKLTISGTGAMNDYKSNTQPWSSYKDNITSVEIGYGVESIGKNAFIDCTGLTSIEIPYSVTSIGADAFYNCTNITDVYCYADPEELTWNDGGWDDFKRDGTTVCHVGGEDYLEYVKKFGDSVNVTFDTDAPHGKCGKSAYWLFVPDTGNLTIYGKGAMDSADWAPYIFEITSVIIGDGITSIGNNAFSNCTDLTSVTIPDSVTSIGDSAFLNCTALTSIVIPAKVTSIGSAAFTLCTGITDVYCYADPSKLTWNDAYSDFKDNRETVCHVPKEEYDIYCSKFSIPDESHYRVNVTFAGDLVDMGLGEHLYGHSISLEGDIGVNFYMELSDELLESDTAEMVFTVPNGSKTETQTLPVWLGNEVSIGGKTYYKFRCSISAKEMTAPITAQMKDGDKTGSLYSFTVRDYADYLLAHTEGNAEYTKAAPLVKAMLNYGACAQIYFDYNTDDLANKNLADNDRFENWDVTSIDNIDNAINAPYNENATTLPTGVTFEGATLSLKSETTLSLYFKGLSDNTKFTCGYRKVETEKNGSYMVARIRGINAEELKNDFTVTIKDSDSLSVTYSPMTYCYNVVNSTATSNELKNVCRALYQYAQAANPNG